jgi:tRNA threonylcarbamoyladenosine biosynthesis protein TsaE
LYHFDVYRISDPEEFFNIGAEDYLNGNGVCIVEWADLVKSEMPEDTLYIFIEYGEKEGERIYRCTF